MGLWGRGGGRGESGCADLTWSLEPDGLDLERCGWRDLPRWALLSGCHGWSRSPVRDDERWCADRVLGLRRRTTAAADRGAARESGGVSAYGRDLGPFTRFYERLQEGGRLIRFDKRGHGFSDRGRGESTLDSVVRDLTAVADAATGGPIDLVGVSLGGQAAVRYAATAPHKVRRLVLIGSIGEFNERERATSCALAEMYRANWGSRRRRWPISSG